MARRRAAHCLMTEDRMAIRRSIVIALGLAAAAAAAVSARDASASVVEKSAHIAGVDVQYKVVLPDGYDAAKAYPAVLVLGGGPQTMDTVERTSQANFRS